MKTRTDGSTRTQPTNCSNFGPLYIDGHPVLGQHALEPCLLGSEFAKLPEAHLPPLATGQRTTSLDAIIGAEYLLRLSSQV